MQAGVTVDVSQVVRALNAAQRRQLPYAMRNALTNSARVAQAEVQAEMVRAFANPSRFTLNSVYAKPAYLHDQTADVHFRDWAPKGTAAGKYLRPQIYGGPRDQKPFERLLQQTGAGRFFIPRPGMDPSTTGGMNRGQLVKVLSALRVMRDPHQNASRTRKSRGVRRNETYFAVQPGRPGLKAGVYRRGDDGDVAVILSAIRQPTYRKRFRFYEVSRDTMRAAFPEQFRRAMEHAMATARE